MYVQGTLEEFIASELIGNDEDNLFDHKTRLIETGIIDSMGIMKLLAFIEETYSIQLNDGEIVPDNFETVDTIVALIDKKMV